MEIRQEALRQLKNSIFEPGLTTQNEWFFRTIYGLPLEITRKIYRFALEKYLPVAKELWSDHKNVEILLNSKDEELEKLKFDDFKELYRVHIDCTEMPYQGQFKKTYDSMISYYDSFRYLKEFGVKGYINCHGFNASVIATAIAPFLFVWSPFLNKNKPDFCKVPKDFTAPESDMPPIFFYRWYEIYEWLIKEKVALHSEIKNWKRVERDFFIFDYLHYQEYYSSFSDEREYESDQKREHTKKFVCPEWKDIYGNLCEEDPQPHLTADDPYDAV